MPPLLNTIIGYGTSPAQQDMMLLGVLTHIWLLAEPINDEIRQKMNEEMRTYQKEKAVYDTLGKERQNRECPKLPINRMFLITGNNTGTGITQNLIDSDGTELIFETEADTLSGAIASD